MIHLLQGLYFKHIFHPLVRVSIPMAFTTLNLLHIGSSFLPALYILPNGPIILSMLFPFFALPSYIYVHVPITTTHYTKRYFITFTCSTLSSITLTLHASCFLPTLIAMSYASLRSFPTCQLLQIVIVLPWFPPATPDH